MADPSTKREEQTKGALAPLRSAPEFLQLVLDTNPSLIFVKDFDGRFILVNKATAEIYGTTAENLTGRQPRQVWPSIEGPSSQRLRYTSPPQLEESVMVAFSIQAAFTRQSLCDRLTFAMFKDSNRTAQMASGENGLSFRHESKLL